MRALAAARYQVGSAAIAGSPRFSYRVSNRCSWSLEMPVRIALLTAPRRGWYPIGDIRDMVFALEFIEVPLRAPGVVLDGHRSGSLAIRRLLIPLLQQRGTWFRRKAHVQAPLGAAATGRAMRLVGLRAGARRGEAGLWPVSCVVVLVSS
jgi:hypothetical protein